MKNWKKFLNEAQYERPSGRQQKSDHDRALSKAERELRSGDVRSMFREEISHALVSAYNHKAQDPRFFRRFRQFLRMSNRQREVLHDDLKKIIEIYANDEQERVRAGGWPEWIKRFSGRYYDQDYGETPIYDTYYLGPAEEPSSVFDGQPIQVANEDFLMPTLEKLKSMLEREISLALRRSKTTSRADRKEFKDKEWIKEFYGVNVRRPDEPTPEDPPVQSRLAKTAQLSYKDLLDMQKTRKR
jgi:hypothetical protein